MNENLPLPPVIETRLREFEAGRKRLLAMRGLAETLLVFCAGMAATVLVELVLRVHFSACAVLSVANYTLTATMLVWRVIVPSVRRSPLRQVAWDLEAAARFRFRERIVSAVELSERSKDSGLGVSRWMIERTIALAAEEMSAVKIATLLQPRQTIAAWKRSAGALACGLLLLLIPGMAPRAWLALNPYAAGERARLQLAVEPGDFRLRQGTPLEIKARGATLPEQALVSINWADGFLETVPMTRSESNLFTLKLNAVTQPFKYRVEAGEAKSSLFTVAVDLPPRLARIQTVIEPPAYTHGTNQVIAGGSAEFLVGSRVRLLLESADEPVAEAEWISDLPAVRHFQPGTNGLFLELEPTNLISYQLRLTGRNGLQSEPAQKWTLRPVADQPPTVKLSLVGSEPGMVLADEILPLQILAADDVGLKKVEIIALTRASQVSVKTVYAADQHALQEFKQPLNYNLAELNCATGDELQLQLIATDLRDQTTRSEPLSFSIGAGDKGLEAQLAVRVAALISELMDQADDLQQTRSSWLSIARNYNAQDAASQRPAFAVLRSQLDQFGSAVDFIGAQLAAESETNHPPEARFMYRLGTTISAWGRQTRQVLLVNCARLDQSAATNVTDVFNLGRELFSRALLDIEHYRKVLSVLEGVFQTDVLATRCEAAQGRYKRGLPVLRGENVIAPLGRNGPGLMATFFEGVNLEGRIIEQKIEKPAFDDYAPAGRREYWSARYEGDINIGAEGEWILACVSDDGVRLQMDGRSLLPTDSWANHPATQFSGEARLARGWHPVLLEFFQGTSQSKLRLLYGRKGESLQEVPVDALRPPAARETASSATNAVLNAIARQALKDRVKSGLQIPVAAPATAAALTNDVESEHLARLVRDTFPVGVALSGSLAQFDSWSGDESHAAEGQADTLTSFSKDAQKILREELEKYRWRYEGPEALKQIQNALQELRNINQELRQQPYHEGRTRTEQEQAKIELAGAWQKELNRASAEMAHDLFQTAERRDATLAQRITALNELTKLEQDFDPAVAKLETTLQEMGGKDEVASHIEQRVNELNDRFRELSNLQEKINREEIASSARKAFPAARNFARAQQSQAEDLAERHHRMKTDLAGVLHAARVAGDYSEADRLENLAGSSPERAQGRETAQMVRELANRTDRNIASLGQSIPPPMRQETQALEQKRDAPAEAVSRLATPRLGMALETARLAQKGDRQTAVAYSLLGEDLGALMETPDHLTAATLQPLADRAAALAGEKGEPARQAEIRAANERARRLAEQSPENPDALANRLEEMSVRARQAAGDPSQRAPLNQQLTDTSKLASPVPDWYGSLDPREIAAGAAQEAKEGIDAAPKEWGSFNDASQTLAEAARQIQMNQAASDLAALDPYPAPPGAEQLLTQAAPSSSDHNGDIPGQAGTAITQPAPRGLDQADWARLNARLRQGIHSSGIEQFSEEQQAAIRAYFERLSSDSQKAK